MLLQDLAIVVQVAQTRSITKAAQLLDLKTATASAAIKRVEKTLGEPLFVRTTRQLRLSGAGERYLPKCQQALALLDQAQNSLGQDSDTLTGELRLAVSSDLGRNRAVQWLDELLGQHPQLSMRLHISDSNVDFYRDNIDIALRYGPPPADSKLVGFKICPVPSVLCASPDYLTRCGEPQHPEQLPHHNGLFYQLHETLYNQWLFAKGDQRYKIKMTGNRAGNDGDLVRRWCIAGYGLAVKSCLDVAQDLLNGSLIPVMTDYQPRPTELWLMCPSRHTITPSVRLLRDNLRQRTRTILSQLVSAGHLDKQVLS